MKKDFRRKKRKGGKLDDRWLGPYTISADCGKGFYSLNDGQKMIVKRINGYHLKVYYETDDPQDQPNLSSTSSMKFRNPQLSDLLEVCVYIYSLYNILCLLT